MKVRWEYLHEVIAYATRLGPGMLVIKYPDRGTYNITHASREAAILREGARVVFR